MERLFETISKRNILACTSRWVCCCSVYVVPHVAVAVILGSRKSRRLCTEYGSIEAFVGRTHARKTSGMGLASWPDLRMAMGLVRGNARRRPIRFRSVPTSRKLMKCRVRPVRRQYVTGGRFAYGRARSSTTNTRLRHIPRGCPPLWAHSSVDFTASKSMKRHRCKSNTSEMSCIQNTPKKRLLAFTKRDARRVKVFRTSRT